MSILRLFWEFCPWPRIHMQFRSFGKIACLIISVLVPLLLRHRRHQENKLFLRMAFQPAAAGRALFTDAEIVGVQRPVYDHWLSGEGRSTDGESRRSYLRS